MKKFIYVKFITNNVKTKKINSLNNTVILKELG